MTLNEHKILIERFGEELTQVAPLGGEKVVKALKKKKVKNPWAIAWAMKNRGEI